MKKLILLTTLFFALANAHSQNLIAIQHNGTATFETRIDSAVSHAQSGDTIYLPGGAFQLPAAGLVINKKLAIIGVGHNPDSTAAYGAYTLLGGGNLIYITGADYSTLSGVYLNTGTLLYIGDPANNTLNKEVNGLVITRCNISYLLFYRGTLASNPSKWCTFSENVFRSNIEGGLSYYNSFFNNIFFVSIIYFNGNNVFKNNVSIYSGNPFQYVTNCIFENNIFNYPSFNSCDYNIYRNNVNVGNGGTNSIYSGNSWTISINSVFVGGNISSLNPYTFDFHLAPTCPAKNGGTDGTDVGIYGGSYPWKDGSVPANPHIQTKFIAPKTNNQNSLPVQIKVKAQDN